MSARDSPLATLPAEHNGVRLLKLIQQRHPDYHPALSIAKIAHEKCDDDPDLEFKCHATLLKYIEPELKSVQVQAEIKETRTIRVSLFEMLDGSEQDSLKAIEEAKSNAPKLPAIVDVEFTRETVAVQEPGQSESIGE